MLFAALFLAAAGLAGYFYYQDRNSLQSKDVAEGETLVAIIGKAMELPDGETPTLATVTNKNRLDNQSFFARAENGDKILIYPLARKAFLYRSATGKVLDMAEWI